MSNASAKSGEALTQWRGRTLQYAKKMRVCHLMIGGAVLLLGGCSTIPPFEDRVYGERRLSPTVDDMTHEVQCEILDVLRKSKEFANEDPDKQVGDDERRPFAALALHTWVVSVNLTLDITADEGVNPSLSYIDPLSTANPTLTGNLDAQFSKEQHRNINVEFTLLVYSAAPTDSSCDPAKNDRPGLRGNLGIAQIMATGLPYAVGGVPYGTAQTTKTPYIMVASGVGATGAPSSNPVFGSTVDFSIVYGLGGTPTWTFTHFAGLGSASGNLLTAMRTHKDTLVLSVAQASGLDASAIGDATKAAQDNTTRMILQRLVR